MTFYLKIKFRLAQIILINRENDDFLLSIDVIYPWLIDFWNMQANQLS